jgi:hypothetical protein
MVEGNVNPCNFVFWWKGRVLVIQFVCKRDQHFGLCHCYPPFLLLCDKQLCLFATCFGRVTGLHRRGSF